MLFTETRYGKFYYFQNDDIGRRISRGEFFDEHFKPWMDKLGVGDTLVDVGANIGFFSVYVGLRGANVVAFEASSEVEQVLRMNLAENGLPQVSINCALYDSEVELGVNPEWRDWVSTPSGKIDYERSPNSGGLSLVRGGNGFKAKTLDSFSLQSVTLLKIDTQGADLRVLVGAINTINRYRPIVCFEYEDGGRGTNASGDSLEDFQKFFLNIGYGMRKVWDGMCGSDYVAVPA